MTPNGRAVVDALSLQGFLVTPEVNEAGDCQVITRDGKRVHNIPAHCLHGTRPQDLGALKLAAAGLEIIEGFIAPAELWDM